VFDILVGIAARDGGAVDNIDVVRGQVIVGCWRLARVGGEEARSGGLTVDGPAGSIHNM
jgi:hypothetical protein